MPCPRSGESGRGQEVGEGAGRNDLASRVKFRLRKTGTRQSWLFENVLLATFSFLRHWAVPSEGSAPGITKTLSVQGGEGCKAHWKG